MDKPKELPQRKPTRLKNFDYSSQGAYFLTICTEDRKRILSRIVGGDVLDAPKYAFATDVELLPHGKICEKYIRQMNDFYDDIKVDRYVIMPNHIHIMLFVFENGASRTSPPTGLGDFGRRKTKVGGSGKNVIFLRTIHRSTKKEDCYRCIRYVFHNLLGL